MKFCILYHPKMKKLVNKVDEICIKYNPKDKTLTRFMQQYPRKRFIIALDAGTNLTELVKIKQGNPDLNLALKFSFTALEDAKQSLTECAESGIPAFLDIVAKDWDTFNGLLALGVSDVYIGEDLGFDLVRVSKKAKGCGSRLRTFPNVCQTSWRDTNAIKTFFIRPEDAEFYSQYIDCYEFFTDKQNIQTLYKIYAVDKKWFGNLQELIIGFNTPLDSRSLLDTFAQKRIRCNKKCIKGEYCQLCDRYAKLAEIMSKNSLYFKS